ncbi:isochorismate synthase [Actinobacillus succinogenes]|uniref:Isochorismate synthase MenF n=1 Tax=Actinobacillus succinogenes (strain ATCC 55618 / DSM 22257 / CCUG 43843 / 130Z) TaxID=339671 RepID=A6VMF7_ACTSZ|nr:isochorismate synthase [Actinobacillus succinogenes]ABR74154.1 isochorismate synthase [Actinobacillus succinogenes 130Z]PHI39415.1 isochorismate synthase [Actinobacillus succinogenes]
MERLQHALSEQIKTHSFTPQSQTITAFRAETAAVGSLLSWLKGQVMFPQYYLNFRDNSRCIAAIGKVRSFSDEISAQQFVRRTDLLVAGGLTFDKRATFWLPRMVLEQKNNKLYATLYTDGEQPPQNERQAALDAVKTLSNYTALLPVRQTLRLESQKADENRWCEWVQKAVNAIERGDFTKVVLANESCFIASNPIDSKDFLAESEKQNTGCYHFLYAENPQQVFVGSTPERLFARQNNFIRTEALAGTAAMSEDPIQNQREAAWLLSDPKNDNENLLVVKDICDNLADYVRRTDVGEVGLKQLRRVQHLRRRIRAELKPPFSDAACLRAIHPTAAVSGLPQKNALDFLKNTENFDRTWYAGTLGVMTKEHSEFCVTIRSAFIESNKIRVFAGAGIVAGSVPLLEWQEIERKASGLLTLLTHRGE